MFIFYTVCLTILFVLIILNCLDMISLQITKFIQLRNELHKVSNENIPVKIRIKILRRILTKCKSSLDFRNYFPLYDYSPELTEKNYKNIYQELLKNINNHLEGLSFLYCSKKYRIFK